MAITKRNIHLPARKKRRPERSRGVFRYGSGPDGPVHSSFPRNDSTTVATSTAVLTSTAFTADRTLLVVSRFFFKHAVRETELTGLFVDIEELHAYHVAFLDAGFLHRFKATPCNLAMWSKPSRPGMNSTKQP